jgi:hypothetical protein
MSKIVHCLSLDVHKDSIARCSRAVIKSGRGMGDFPRSAAVPAAAGDPGQVTRTATRGPYLQSTRCGWGQPRSIRYPLLVLITPLQPTRGAQGLLLASTTLSSATEANG